VTDRLERLVNLTATLLETRRPLTLDELAERIEPSYPEQPQARHRQFERDKETLRGIGILISVESVDALGGELGYRIHPDDYYLPDPGLTADERAALHLAATAVALPGLDARDALRKLGGIEGEAAAVPLASFELTDHLGDLFEAVTRRARITFEYRGEVRTLEPHGVLHRFGHWYAVGHDPDRDGIRSFRLDRFESAPVAGPAGAFTIPDGLDPGSYLAGDPISFGDDQPQRATVLVDAVQAGLVVEQLGDESVVEHRADGSVVVALDVVNRDAFRSWVLGLLDHAEVLDPPGLRALIVEWLTEIVDPEDSGRGTR
jgi:predicted DNA-binding transcriptional regulator YafY